MVKKDAVMIDWFGDIFGLWCWRCLRMTIMYRVQDDLRCTECNFKVAEKLDAEYVKLLREDGKIH